MNKCLAIAGLTLRTVVRSRVLALLASLVLISVVVLPFIMKSDGTLAGTVQLYLHYTFGWTMLILSIAAIWAGAGGFAREVETRQVHLVVTKPVRSLQLWFGKWLGLMAMNAILLCLAGVFIYGMLRWTTRAATLSADERSALRKEILVARKELFPAPEYPDIHQIPVLPAAQHGWRFKLPAKLRSTDTVFVQFRFASSRVINPSAVNGMWLTGPENAPDRYQISTDAAPNISHQFQVPTAALEPGRFLIITYSNLESKRPATLLFSVNDGVKLLIREGGFEMNFVRALLMMLARLGFFSALGLTTGALFSLPVAVFTSFAFLFVTGFNRFIERVAESGLGKITGMSAKEASSIWNSVLQELFFAVSLIMPPLSRFEPLNILPDGGLISWSLVGETFLVLVGIYSVCLALLGAWLFSRRELGL